MANTKRFNVTVKLGGKSYPPGEDVPIGGKSGLSKEEADGIEDRFGPWKGRSLSDAEKIAHLTKEKQALEAQLRQVEEDNEALADSDAKRIASLTKEKQALDAQLRQVEKDNEVLANRVRELEDLASAGKDGAGKSGGGSD